MINVYLDKNRHFNKSPFLAEDLVISLNNNIFINDDINKR